MKYTVTFRDRVAAPYTVPLINTTLGEAMLEADELYHENSRRRWYTEALKFDFADGYEIRNEDGDVVFEPRVRPAQVIRVTPPNER